MAKSKKLKWINKVGNVAQAGGIETSVLDNGPGRGNRIAWINTGSGLTYKVAIDRACDIVEAFYNGQSLSWLSHGGMLKPRPDANSGLEWLRTFQGGLVTTCGLSHIGGPETDDTESRGLHGRISNMPAAVESIIQPDIYNGKIDFSITAYINETSVFQPRLELKRTISGTLGQPEIHIKDIVTNCGNTTVPHMYLYHCNFGYPLLDEGAKICFKGDLKSRSATPEDDKRFASNEDYTTVPAPRKAHSGFGEACAFIDPKSDKNDFCTTGIVNEKLSLGAKITFNKKQLPCLTNWQHFGEREYVVGLEPGTNPPIGQNQAKKQKTLTMLKPGKAKTYQLKIEVLTTQKQLKALL